MIPPGNWVLPFRIVDGKDAPAHPGAVPGQALALCVKRMDAPFPDMVIAFPLNEHHLGVLARHGQQGLLALLAPKLERAANDLVARDVPASLGV